MLNKKIKKRKLNFSVPIANIIGLLISSLIGIFVITILTLVVSCIISKSSNYPLHTEIYFCGCVGFGALIGGFISAKKCNFKGFVSGFISSFVTSFLITIIMLFFSSGKLNEKTLILFSLIVVCSTIGGIISANTKKR